MFGKLGDMMGRIKEMKEKAEEVKLKLEHALIKSEGAGGDIRMEMNGNRKLLKLEIDPALQHGDSKELQQQLLQAFNQASKEAERIFEEEMKKAAGSILPGM